MFSHWTHTMKFLVLLLAIVTAAAGCNTKKEISFHDDFENGTPGWEFINPDRIRVIDSGDPEHKKVLSLQPGGAAVYALLKGSHEWGNVKIEGDVYFPYPYSYTMELIYNYRVSDNGARTDFGSVYIGGPNGEDFVPYFRNAAKYNERPPGHFLGNIVNVNHQRAGVEGFALYPESWTVLTGDAAIKSGEWGHFKAEIIGSTCHFYIKDMETPVITDNLFEFSSGTLGFKPNFTGSECRIDNIRVTSIEKLSYQGPPLPGGRNYKRDQMITQWDAIGPAWKRIKEIETEGFITGKTYRVDNRSLQWRPFETDARGCVIGGRISNRYATDNYFYLHTEITSETDKEITLRFSSVNLLVLWANKKKAGNVPRKFATWYDFLENPEHKGNDLKVPLTAGKNHIVILVNGGRIIGDGFYAHIVKETEPPKKESSDQAKDQNKDQSGT